MSEKKKIVKVKVVKTDVPEKTDETPRMIDTDQLKKGFSKNNSNQRDYSDEERQPSDDNVRENSGAKADFKAENEMDGTEEALITVENKDNSHGESKINDIKTTIIGLNTKQKMVACLLFVAVLFGIGFGYNNYINSKLKVAQQCVHSYKTMQKDPDSMILRGDVLVVNDKEEDWDRYVCFVSSGKNSYGATVTSMPIFKNGSYLCDYTEENESFSYGMSDDEIHDLLQSNLEASKARLKIAEAKFENEVGDGVSETIDFQFYNGKRIAKNLKIGYAEE